MPPVATPRTPPRPRPALRVGVTGHRLNRLLEPNVDLEGLRAQVRTVLSTVRAAVEQAASDYGEVYAGAPLLRLISPLAEGADQLVASEALELGYSLHVPLPCLPEIYTAEFQRSAGGKTEDPCAGFQRLIARAEAVQVIDGSPAVNLDGAAYAAVGRAVLRHADLLIAIWDQSPADGAGGTAAVVDQARSWLLPVLVIDPRHPVSARLDDVAGLPAGADLATVIEDLLAPPPADAGAAKPSWWRRAFHVPGHHATPSPATAAAASPPRPTVTEPLLQYLGTRVSWGIGGLFTSVVGFFALDWPPRPRVMTLGRARLTQTRKSWDALWSSPPPLEPAIVQPITQLLREPYAWSDGLADRFGTLHRDLSTTPYALAPLAVIAILLAQIGLTDAGAGPAVRSTVEFLILFANFLLYLRAVHAHYHDRWIDCRSLAEQLRYLAFLWPLGRPLRAVRYVGDDKGEAPRIAWVGWYARAIAREGGLFPIVFTAERLAACREIVVARFIQPQLAYHTRASRRNRRVHTVLHRVALVLFAGAMILSAADFVSVLWTRTPLTQAGLSKGLGWAAIAAAVAILLPGIGTGVHGFLSQGDFWNLCLRSEKMTQQLEPLIKTVESTPLTLEALGNIAEDAAETMRDEVLNWRVFARLKAPVLV
jgi:hypothetical protein